MSAENPISPKAVASTGGAGLGAAVGTLVIWILGVTFWDASTSAAKASDAVAAVPTPVSGVIVLIIPAVVAALAGYFTSDPHRVTTEDLNTLQLAKAQAQK